MQRIDENTYIDDTLVTCAEYQLFIDEMREQGKFYQPDHWISYQFPEGQALEPLLGVRPIDARSFCEWLTIREAGGWRYRLPVFAESIDYPTKRYSQTQLGYWIWDIDAPLFILIGDTSVVEYGIRANLAHAIENILNLADLTETARIANHDLEKDMEIALDLNLHWISSMGRRLMFQISMFLPNLLHVIYFLFLKYKTL